MGTETELERRLREILTEYSNIDPARATAALKGQPEATNEQIALLSKASPKEPERGSPKPHKTISPPSEGKTLALRLAKIALGKDPNDLAAKLELAIAEKEGRR
jgi:hypothetical protein